MDAHCLIIHACPGNTDAAKDPRTRTYDKHWLPWTKKALETRGIPTIAPLMPQPWAPVYEEYKKEFEKYPVSEDTILIAHSGGCAFLIRWLGDTKQVVKQLVLVAPWKIEHADPVKKAFYDFPIDASIASRVGQITFFTSDNEKEDGKQSLQIFHETLGGEVIELPGQGHYTLGDMGTEEFPEIIDAILGKG